MRKTVLSSLLLVSGSTALAFSLAAGELTVNGDFETGDTSSWVSFPTANSTFDVTMDAATGSFAAEVFNDDPAAAAVIKQANLGVGIVSPGDTVTITFAAKGMGAVGGITFAEFFSEIAGGGVSSSEILGGAPLGLTADYQTFSFTTTAGADVSGGITLQFAVVTGAATGSLSQLFVDDASVTVAGAGGVTSYCVGGVNNDGETCAISTQGSVSLAANDLELVATGVSSLSTFGLFVMGDVQDQTPFGSGFLCLSTAGQFLRLNPVEVYSDVDVVTRSVDYGAFPTSLIAAGDTWNFQFLYRDAGVTNASDGVSICFLP